MKEKYGTAWLSQLVRIGLGVAVVAIASAALAFEEPTNFRGVPWGAPEREVVANLGGRSPDGKWRGVDLCSDYSAEDRSRGDRHCDGAFLLGTVVMGVHYDFRSDRVTRITMYFDSFRFDAVERIFVERYGTPTRQSDIPVTTRGGAEIANRTLSWEGAKISISLYHYGATLTTSMALFTMAEEEKESARLRGKDANDAAKGL